jgi:hypothetical protein
VRGTLTMLGSPALTDEVIAVAVDGLATVLDPRIAVEASKGATLHMSDTPLPLVSPGSPATVANPMRSLFQTDALALRAKLGVTWAKRHASAVAWLTTTAW